MRKVICYKYDGTLMEFPNYVASEEGKVYSLSYNKTKKLKECVGDEDKNGYIRLTLTDSNGKKQGVRRCRCIASTFIGNPGKYMQVNHKDEIKTNDALDNIEWCDNKYNANYGTRNKRVAEKLKLVDKTYRKIPVVVYKIVGTFASIDEAAKAIGAKPCNVSNALKNGTPTHNYIIEKLSV